MVLINRFEIVDGSQVINVHGQSRFGYNHSDAIEFYEVEDVIKVNGFYKGNTISFYDYETGRVYLPFELKKNVVYGYPVYINTLYYFIQCDFETRKINAVECFPGGSVRIYKSLNMDEVDLGNIMIMDDDLKIVSQENDFRCYYPEQIRLSLEPSESVVTIDEGKVYINQWIEEGYDDVNNGYTNAYQYYDKLIIKDLSGNKICDKVGYLSTYHNDQLWLS
ncbi:hypothetical protein [Macrococcus epidermidis]|uniref:hypothetical protein n=1 Tax=Macrococcus epidermidis TaxID=1902580 RepID=UPI0020B6C984|nr:hypothetical protein [Macrococcus epidermidis]UTH15862.1 hypothetical protein KFV12_11335 [Macrococcus epidermidis]